MSAKHNLTLVAMLVTLVFTFKENAVKGQLAELPKEMISVEETLGAVFLREPVWSVYARANKEAKLDLYRLLDHPDIEKYHPAIITMIGFVGDGSDVDKIEKILFRYSGELQTSERLVVQSVFQSLGIMSRRGLVEATVSLHEMLKPDFAQTLNFSWPSVARKGVINNAQETLSWIVRGYAFSGRDDLEAKIGAILATVQPPEAKRYMQGAMRLEEMTAYAKQIATMQAETIPSDVRKALPELFNKDFENPARRKLMPAKNSKNTPPVKASIATQISPSLKEEALKAFSEIKETFLKNDYESLAKHLADNGKPVLPLEKQTPASIASAAAKLKSMSKDFDVTKNLLSDLQGAGIHAGHPEGETLSDGTLVVKIPCAESANIKRKFLAKHHGTRTASATEELIIYMIQKDGHWYWNPFGW